MMITNGTLSDIENWFYEGNHKYYWMAILLPSLQSCGIIRQLLDDIERIDRITADNVAFMTFFNEQEFDDVSRQCGLQRHVLFQANGWQDLAFSCCRLSRFLGRDILSRLYPETGLILHESARIRTIAEIGWLVQNSQTIFDVTQGAS